MCLDLMGKYELVSRFIHHILIWIVYIIERRRNPGKMSRVDGLGYSALLFCRKQKGKGFPWTTLSEKNKIVAAITSSREKTNYHAGEDTEHIANQICS